MNVKFKLPGMRYIDSKDMTKLVSMFDTKTTSNPQTEIFTVYDVLPENLQYVINKVLKVHTFISIEFEEAEHTQRNCNNITAVIDTMPPDVRKQFLMLVNLTNNILSNIPKVDARRVSHYLISASTELCMGFFSYKDKFVPQIGDVVDCNYGMHNSSEISGGHVHAIVCDIIEDEDTVFLLPMTKVLKEESDSYIQCKVGIDIVYDDQKYFGGTVLVKKGRYVSRKRINSIIGHVSVSFFEKIVQSIQSAFNYTSNCIELEYMHQEANGELPDMDDIFDSSSLILPDFDKDICSCDTCDSSDESPISHENSRRKIAIKNYLFEKLHDEFMDTYNKEKENKSLDIVLYNFLNNILHIELAYSTVDSIFKEACALGDTNYSSIKKVVKSRVNKDQVKELNNAFRKWLREVHPEILEEYSRITYIHLIMVAVEFMKRIQSE